MRDRRATAPPSKLPPRAKCRMILLSQELQASHKDLPLNYSPVTEHSCWPDTDRTNCRRAQSWSPETEQGGCWRQSRQSGTPIEWQQCQAPQCRAATAAWSDTTTSGQNPYLNAEWLPAPGNQGQNHS